MIMSYKLFNNNLINPLFFIKKVDIIYMNKKETKTRRKENKMTGIKFTKKELEQWYDDAYCLEAVKQNGYSLQYVRKEYWHLFKEQIID